MKTNEYLWLLPQFLTMLPAALLCYLPMKNHLKYPPLKILTWCLMIFVPYTALAALLCYVSGTDMNIIVIPSFVLLFLFYKRTIEVDFARAAAVFTGVCVLMTFPSQFSYAFDSLLYPTSGSADFSIQAAFFQFLLSCLFTAALSVPCLKAYSRMVTQLPSPHVWYPVLAIHIILFFFQIAALPLSYQTLYTGRILIMFFILETILLLLFIFLHVIFYYIANTISKYMELEKHSHLLEMQAEQYRSLQNYMRQTRQLRHDFRHSIHILSSLAGAGNLEGLKAYLHEYEQQLNVDTPINYCSNTALNALFNYYRAAAAAAGIKTDWQLDIPEPLTVSELDLASLFGNLMENAISGCQTLPEKERRFSLSAEVRQENFLYIVSTNSFNGRTRKIGANYLSTKRNEKGIGLLSITAISQKYNGSARVSNNDCEFFVDVVLKI